MSEVPASLHARQWYIIRRWQEYAGEARANLLRMIAIGVFYGLQLVQFYLLSEPNESEAEFQRAATALAVAGLFVSLAVQLCLQRHVFPAALKYFSTAADIALVTSIGLSGSGPQSPVRLAFFLIIAMAALRFSLPLVWCASLGTMLGYLVLLGAADRSWFDAEHVVPPIEQLVTLASLVLTGIVMGQVVRRVRGIAQEYCVRAGSAPAQGVSA